MGRIRTVKPELFRHLGLFEAEEKYQLPLRIAFVGLFTCCDRQGRFVWQPRRLKAEILPYDDIDIIEVLNALIESGFIKAYEVDGIIYGCIPTWGDHQYFNNKEAHSKLPDVKKGKILKGRINQSTLSVHAKLSEDAFLRELNKHNSSVDHSSNELSLDEESTESEISIIETGNNHSPELERVSHASSTGESREPYKGRERNRREWKNENGKERKKEEGKLKNSEPPPESVFEIFTYWQKVMEQPQAKLDNSRREYISAALAMGYDVATLCEAIDGCAVTPHNMGKNQDGFRFNGLNIIFKSADQIDRFVGNARSPPQATGKSEQRLQSNIQAAEMWLTKNAQHEEMNNGNHG